MQCNDLRLYNASETVKMYASFRKVSVFEFFLKIGVRAIEALQQSGRMTLKIVRSQFEHCPYFGFISFVY